MQSDQASVENTWDLIAESFDITRKKPWKLCLDFINNLKKQNLVIDIGCGNGRHLIPCAKNCYQVIGIDISQKLLKIAKNKLTKKNVTNVSLIHSNAINLPLTNNSIDVVLFIATLHNIQGKENRIHTLQEIARVLKKNGVALISVWSRWQHKFWGYFIKQFIIRSREFGDIDILWKQNNLNVFRFYHLYSKAEFLQELQQVDLYIQRFQRVKIHSKYIPDNYFAVLKKK